MKDIINPKALYNTAETAKFLNLGVVSLCYKAHHRQIVASKIGRGYLFLGKDILDYIKSKTVARRIANL